MTGRLDRVGSVAAFAGLATALLAAFPLQADYDAAIAVEQGALQHWKVSSDGKTWTQAADIIASSSVRQLAAPGDGYVYVPNGSSIDRYQCVDGEWSKVDSWKTGLSGIYRLAMSQDRVWFYVAGDWANANTVARYRISDPSVGGSLSLQNKQNFTRCRNLILGRDGMLYCGARGNGTTGVDPLDDPTRGIMAYDTTVAGVPFRCRYKVPVANTGIGIVLDDNHGRINAVANAYRWDFGMGGGDALAQTKITGQSNPFCGAEIGGMKFYADYGGCVWLRDPDANTQTKIPTVEKCNAISDMTLMNTTGSNLPNVSGVWYMNEMQGATVLVNGANPGTFDMTLSGTAKAGASGVLRGGVRLCDGNGRGVIADSSMLVPGTGNFTISLWLLVGTDRSCDRKLFSNGRLSIGLTMSGKPYVRIGEGESGEFAIYGSNTAIEEMWHWIVVRRNGGKFEIWLDNKKGAEGAYDLSTSIASDFNWVLGAKPTGEDTFTGNVTAAFFDELRVYPCLLNESDLNCLYGLARPYVKSESGTILPEVRPPTGWQSSTAALGGRQYAAFDGRILTYADGSFTERGSIPGLDSISLFASGDTLFAVGRDGEGYLAIARSAGGDEPAWTAPERIGGGLFVPNLTATQPALVGGRVWLGTVAPGGWDIGFVSFALDGTEASDPQVTRSFVPTHESSSARQCQTDLVFARAFARANDVFAVGASKRSLAVRGEAWQKATADPAAPAAKATHDGTVGFPAGSKPFGVVWDETTRRHWLVSAAYHRADKLVSRPTPFYRATAIAVYSSPDLQDWQYHGDYTAAGVGYYYRPTPIIDGDSLVVAYADAVNGGKERVLVIGNFRRLYKDTYRRKKELFEADQDDKCVYKYFYEESIKEWVPSGLFCRGTYTDASGSYTMGYPQTVRYHFDRVFVNTRGTGSKGVFEFKDDGTFVRFYSIGTDTDGLGVALDGSKLYATQWWGSNVYVIDRKTGSVTSRNFNVEPKLSVPRGIADVGDGKIAIGSRGTGKLLVWEPDNGDKVTAYGSDTFGTDKWAATGNGPQDIQFDAAAKRLWLGGPACGFGYMEFNGDEVAYTRLGNDLGDNGFTWWNDTTLLYVFYTPGAVNQTTYDPSARTFAKDAVDAVSASRVFDRIFTVVYPHNGTLVLIK